MKTVREREAKEFRAQGSPSATKIRASADKEGNHSLRDAIKTELKLFAPGDEQAIMIWNNAAGQDMEFFALLPSRSEAIKTRFPDGNAAR